MRNIVDEVGEIIAKATDDHTLIGGHHWPPASVKSCSGRIPANQCGLIPSSREVLSDIQLDAQRDATGPNRENDNGPRE